MLGISVDSVPCKAAWARSLNLTDVDLVSDFFPHGEVAQRYGLLRAEGFSERASVLVGRDGRVAWTKVYDVPATPDLGEIFSAIEAVERQSTSKS